MIYVAIGLVVLAVLIGIWLLRLFVEADPGQLADAIGRFLLVLGATLSAVAIIAGLISERVPVVLAGAGGLGLVWFGATRHRRREKAASATTSAVETDYLKMRLDHGTQTIFGTVRRGSFQGRELADLSRAELLSLWQECRTADPPSARLLEGYLDRFAPGWREAMNASSAADAMTRAEAYAVLGISPNASEADIQEAYRRLMRKIHPDHGGSSYLAAKINRARELLLGGS